jgi:hypothetical protein
VTESGMIIDFNSVYPLKAFSPMQVIVLGIVIDESPRYSFDAVRIVEEFVLCCVDMYVVVQI